MELFTKSKYTDWERIVHLYVNDCDDLITNINNKDTCKLILVLDGTGIASIDNKSIVLSAPMLLCLTPSNTFELRENRGIKSSVLYFMPSVINDALTYDKLISGFYKNRYGTTIYQDFVLLSQFYDVYGVTSPATKIGHSLMLNIHNLIKKLDHELTSQKDTFWPCRSRSFFLELLFYLNASLAETAPVEFNNSDSPEDQLLQQIVCYLNENICEKVLLEDISRHFSINRNRLNQLFNTATGLTCMAYLSQMRMNLACIMLADTELPIAEIGERVGFTDTNHFIKTFKKTYSATPSQYRSKVVNNNQ